MTPPSPEEMASDYREAGAEAAAHTAVDPLVVVSRGTVPDDRLVGMAETAGYHVFARDAEEFTLIEAEAYRAKLEAAA